MEGSNPGVQAATANSFTATDFQLKKYVHPMPARLTSLYAGGLQQVLLAAASRELSVCSNFRACLSYVLISGYLDQTNGSFALGHLQACCFCL